MPFDKDKFISQATAGGMAESQAAFLADQMSLQDDRQSALDNLEHKLRTELTGKINDLRGDMEARAMVTRTQMDGLTRDFGKIEARVEGALKTALGRLRRAHYTGSAITVRNRR